jgi:hypothetical protein
MLATGAAWIAVLSSFQVAAQTALPAWVRARGLAVYMLVFMGGMAAGSALWGQTAVLFGIPTALTIAAIGAIAGVAATWRFSLGEGQTADLAPSMHWPAPLVNEELEPDRGPVLVTMEYVVDPENAVEFRKAVLALREIRRRDGAYFWDLFQDAADPSRFVETFMIESWVEHLRQHERLTATDREVQTRIERYHTGDGRPHARHLVASRPRG